MSGLTTAAYDSERHRLFLHGTSIFEVISILLTISQGIAAPHLAVCNIG